MTRCVMSTGNVPTGRPAELALLSDHRESLLCPVGHRVFGGLTSAQSQSLSVPDLGVSSSQEYGVEDASILVAGPSLRGMASLHPGHCMWGRPRIEIWMTQHLIVTAR